MTGFKLTPDRTHTDGRLTPKCKLCGEPLAELCQSCQDEFDTRAGERDLPTHCTLDTTCVDFAEPRCRRAGTHTRNRKSITRDDSEPEINPIRGDAADEYPF
jgi:hypothetical protein